jgi:hypothetical protein
VDHPDPSSHTLDFPRPFRGGGFLFSKEKLRAFSRSITAISFSLLYVAGFSQSAGLTTDQTVRLQLYVSQTIEDALDAGYREGVSHRESG